MSLDPTPTAREPRAMAARKGMPAPSSPLAPRSGGEATEMPKLVGTRLTLHVPPSANRWWRNVNGRMVTSKAARDYKAYVARRMFDQKAEKVPAPIPVCVQISWYRERKSGDLDKRIGIVLDALQGILFDNDSQVVAINAERWEDAKHPRVEIIVIPMGG